jgi:hypothetical protein
MSGGSGDFNERVAIGYVYFFQVTELSLKLKDYLSKLKD